MIADGKLYDKRFVLVRTVYIALYWNISIYSYNSTSVE